MTRRTQNVLLFILGVAAIVLLLIIGPLPGSVAHSAEQAGVQSGEVRARTSPVLPRGAAAQREAREGRRYAECEFSKRVIYKGWARRDVSNHRSVRTMPSAAKPGRWHVYKITRRGIDTVKGGCNFPNI